MRLLGLICVVLVSVVGCGESGVRQPVFSADDQRVIDQLEKAGADLSQPRPVDFYLYFDRERDAKDGANAAETEGSVDVTAPSEGVEQWLVLLTKHMLVNRKTIGELQARLVAIAESHAGHYDGWEAPAEP